MTKNYFAPKVLFAAHSNVPGSPSLVTTKHPLPIFISNYLQLQSRTIKLSKLAIKTLLCCCVAAFCLGGIANAQPVITAKPQPITLTLDASGNHTVTLAEIATVTSSINPNPPVQFSPASFSCGTLGSQSVVVTATDGTFGTPLNPSAVSFRSPRGSVFDAAGNLYIADAGNNKIRVISPAGVVTTFAGSGVAGSTNGTGVAATFSGPTSIAVDPVTGNLYVADANNEVIRKMTPAGVVTTFAGTAGVLGSADGTGLAATFNSPYGVATDASGNVYVADFGNNNIRKITPAGVVTTLAGNGLPTFADGTGTAASFNGPTGLIVDKTGNIYVADRGNNRIRLVTPAGVVTTFAGAAAAGAVNGTGAAARFNAPSGITIDAAGNFYIADANNNRIRKMTSTAVVTILSGSGAAGAVDDVATLASFNLPSGITVDGSGNLYVADQNNNKIRKVTSAGTASSLAGSGTAGATDGNIGGGASGNVSTLTIPVTVVGVFAFASTYSNITISAGSSGSAILPDYTSTAVATENCSINNINFTQSPIGGTKIPAGTTVTVTITAIDVASKTVTTSFTATSVSPPKITPIANNITLALDGSGNRAVLLSDLATVASTINANPPTQITPATLNCSTLGAQTITITATDGTFGTALKPTNATFNAPRSVAFDLSGNMFIADAGNNKIRMISPLGVVTTLAGSGAAGSNNSTGAAATFNNPSAVTTDGSGNVYVADVGNQLIRKITPAGVVTTLAGTGAAGRVNGTGVNASFNNPLGIISDVFGNVYVAEQNNNDIRKITPSGVVTTFAGRATGVAGYVDGPGTTAAFNGPTGLTLDSLGNLYVVDRGNSRIRFITTAGVVSTFAGDGFSAYVEGTGTAASFKNPYDITIDGLGNLYVADAGNNVIRKITPAAVVTTYAGGGAPGMADGTGPAANFNNPVGVVLDANANLFVADQTNNKIRKVAQGAIVTTIAGSGAAGALDGTVGGGATGNVSTLNLAVTVVSSPVITTIFPNVTLSTGTSSSVALPNYTTNATATDNCNGPVAFTQLPTAGTNIPAGTTVMVTLTATDSFGGKTSVLFSVTAVTPPVITPINNNITLTLDGSGNKVLALTDVATVTSSVNPNPPITISPTNFTCSTLGNQTVTVTATDGNFGTPVNPSAVTFRTPRGVIYDNAGNLFVADQGGNRIRKITSAGVVTTFAGSGANGNANGTGTAASFNAPAQLACDGANNIYVADVNNEIIRKITPAGVVTTFAGSGLIGAANGAGTVAQFNTPYGVAADKAGNVYVADYGNSLIRKITSGGVVSTFAGSGVAGFANGTGAAAQFSFPTGIACDSLGNVYVADRSNNRIRKITTAGVVTTVAGSGAYAYADGVATAASFKNPSVITLDPSGNIYVADAGNNIIRMITPAGVVTSLAGGGAASFTNGTGTAATFNSPWGITIDKSNNLYIADQNNNVIRKVTLLGVVTTFAGSGVANSTDGNIGGGANGNVTTLQIPVKVVSTPVITSTYANVTLAIPNGGTAKLPDYTLNATAIDNCTASTITFTQSPAAGTTVSAGAPVTVTLTATDASGSKSSVSFTVTAVNGPAITAKSNITLFLDATGNKTIALSDLGTVTSSVTATPQVQISPASVSCATVKAQTITITATDGSFGTPLTPAAVSFNNPQGVAIDAAGNIYVTDYSNNRIRKISNTGVVSTFVAAGLINNPSGIAIDASGNLYVTDPTHTIKKVTPAGVVSIFAGLPQAGAADGPIASASFDSPSGLATDPSGNLFVADFNNKNIRKISAGVVSTIATFTDGVTNLTTDALGNVYFSTSTSKLIRKITTSGTITLLAGGGTSDNDGTGAAAGFLTPTGMCTDASANVYVAQLNGKIRKISPTGVVVTFAGGNASFVDGTGTAAGFNQPYGLATDGSGNTVVAEFGNNKIRKITPAAVVTTLAGSTTAGSTDGNVGAPASGNVSTLQVPVTVLSAPVITSVYPNVTVTAPASGKVFLTDYTVNATATDNCTASQITFTQTPVAGSLLPLNAAQTVTLTATDASGAKASISFTITALSPPVIVANSANTIITLDATGNKTIQLSDIATVTSLTNPNPPVQLSRTSFNCSTTGPQTVTVTATDGVFASGNTPASGNVSTLVIPVTVVSTPVITSAFPNVVIPVSTSASAPLPNYAATATASDNCTASVITFTQSPVAGTTLPINVPLTVTVTATDASGTTATKSFTVTAQSPPVITPKTNLVFTLDANGNRNLQLSDLATVTSLSNLNPPVKISPASLSCSNLGPQTITVTATDGVFASGSTPASGNVTTVQIPVTVLSTPTITSTYSNINIPVDVTGTATIPDYTATATGSDNCSVSTITFTQSPAAGTTILGNVTITLTLTATDALGSQATKSFTITATKATQTISFLNLPSVTYGVNDFDPAATASSGLPVTYTSSNLAVATIVNGKVHVVGAGTSTISALQAGNANYNPATAATQLITVSPAALTISADNQSKFTNTANPPLTISYSGFVNGDTFASLTSPTTASTAATTASPAGTYPILIGGAQSANYAITFVQGTLTVIAPQVAAVITPKSNNIVFSLDATGNKTIALADVATVTSNNSTFPSVQISPTSFNCSTTGQQIVTVTATNSGMGGLVTTLQIPVTILTQPTITSTYADVTLPVNSSGSAILPNYAAAATAVDNCALNTITFTQAPTPGTAIPINTSITVTLTATDQNGATATASFTATAVRASQTISFAALSPVVYGAADFSPAATSSSTLPITYTSSNAAVATIVNGNIHVVGAGTTTVSAVQSGNSNFFAATTVTQLLTVTQAPLTITANNQTKVYGAVNPAFTFAYSGFVNSDDATKLITQPIATTTATVASPVGNYAINVGSATSANYAISYVAGNLAITPATLTVTANNQVKTYGAANPSLTLAYSGFVNGDAIASLTAQPTASTVATVASPTGVYAITVSGGVSANYSFTYISGTLTINPATLTIMANNQTKVYGAANPVLTVTYAGFANNDNAASLTTLPTVVTTATTLSPVGSYSIFANGAASPNYSIIYINGTLTVTPAALTITANNQTKVYGTANPTLTVTYSGFVNGDTFTSLTAQPTVVTTATAASPIGTYPITASGAASANYAISYVAGSLTVTPAALILTANNQTKVYGSANPTFTVSYTGFVNGDNATKLTTLSTITTTATTSSPIGTYPITPSGAMAPNYTIAYVNGTLTVTQATLIITANNQNKAYGAVNPALTVTYNGFVNNDNVASLTTLPTVVTTATTTSPTGTYPIVASGASSTNYSISYVNGTLTVGTAVLTITANNQTKTYGAANPAFTVSYSGFLNGDTFSSLTTQPTVSTTATAASSTGVYPVTASGAVSANYTINYVAGSLTVTPAALVLSADNQSKGYGLANPPLTITYTGFVNGDNATSLTTQANIATTATISSPIGTYPITVSGAASPNYTISYVGGTLTVTKGVLNITATNQTKVYGAANPALTVTYTGFINGDTFASLTTQPTVVTTATTASVAGTYPITASGATSANYTISYTAGTLTVTPAALTITANNQSKAYGTANPTLTLAYSGFVNGDDPTKLLTQAVPTTTATTTSAAGTYPITASGATSNNYTITYVAGTLTVNPVPLTITAANQTRSFGIANPVFTVTYNGFVNGDTFASLPTQPTVTTTATIASPVGTYPITASGAVSGNYTFAYVPGTLTITPATITFTALPVKNYGDADFAPGATSAIAITYTSSNVNVATIVGGNIHIVGAGTSVITAANGSASVPQTLTVNPVALTITANNQTKPYGSANPSLTLGFVGFVNGETVNNLITQPTVSTTAITLSPIGTYPITVGGVASPNYTIAYVQGTLTVVVATRTLTFNALPNHTYGDADFDPAATVTSGEPITYTSSNTALATIVNGKVHIIGAGTVTITASVPVNSNYTATPAIAQQLVINKFAQTITFAAIPVQQKGGTLILNVTASSGLPIVLTSADPLVATIVGQTVTLRTIGTSVITATQAGDINNLPATATQTLRISDGNMDNVLVHTGVTPNGDGINDFLIIEGIKDYPDNKITIVNRNGAKLFQQSGYDNAANVFDGHSNVNGALLAPGTYFYVLEVNVNGTVLKKAGYIVLKYL